jgi:hypothetical protein
VAKVAKVAKSKEYKGFFLATLATLATCFDESPQSRSFFERAILGPICCALCSKFDRFSLIFVKMKLASG